MQALDHAAVEGDHALAAVLRLQQQREIELAPLSPVQPDDLGVRTVYVQPVRKVEQQLKAADRLLGPQDQRRLRL